MKDRIIGGLIAAIVAFLVSFSHGLISPDAANKVINEIGIHAPVK